MSKNPNQKPDVTPEVKAPAETSVETSNTEPKITEPETPVEGSENQGQEQGEGKNKPEQPKVELDKTKPAKNGLGLRKFLKFKNKKG